MFEVITAWSDDRSEVMLVGHMNAIVRLVSSGNMAEQFKSSLFD